MIWATPYPLIVYVLAVIAALGLLYVARQTANSVGRRSLWFFIPRCLVLAAVLTILLSPVAESARELPPERPKVSCLVDSSRSMGLDLRPRMELAKEFVFDSQSMLDRIESAQLQLYQFGDQLASLPSLSDLTPNDDDSKLGEAMSTLEGIFQEQPKAVVVVSDGQIRDFDELKSVAKNFSAWGIPVHVYPVGANDLQGDVAIERLSVPRRVKARDQAPIRVAIRSQGYDNRRVELRVVRTSDPEGRPLATLPITLRGGSQSHDIVVDADPNAGTLMVSIPLQPQEAIASNNEVPFELLARNRKINVFYMEGTAGSEYRYIRDALQEDPSITCVSAVVDNQYSNRPRLARVDDPYKGFPATRKELFEYDVVICSDINKGAFTREQLQWTAEMVKDRGGGFIMIGGYTSFGAGNWDQTVWDQLIPIDMRGGDVGRGVVNQQFRVSVPAKVRTHSIWRLSEDRRLNDQIIDSMPPFFGTNIAKRLKPAATLLAVSASRVSVAGKTPVFACQTYGRGRSFAMLPDSTVSWGQAFERDWGPGDNRHFRKFWRNVVNWLTENSISAQRRLIVETDKLIYRPGEPIKVSVQALDEQFQPTKSYRVELTTLGPESAKIGRRPLKTVGDRYVGQLTARRITATTDATSTLSQLVLQVTAAKDNEQVATREVTVQVLDDSNELLTPNARPETLEALAKWTEGEVLTSPDDLVRLLGDLKSEPGKRVVHRAPIWDKPWIWLSMLGIVVTEWILRRRRVQ